MGAPEWDKNSKAIDTTWKIVRSFVRRVPIAGKISKTMRV